MSAVLFTQSHGEEHRVSSPQQASIVLIHGLFGSSDNLSVIRRHFEPTHHVLSIDLPDHGKSPRSEHFDFDQWAQQVNKTIETFGLNSALVIAHSLGGKVAMRLASIVPKLVRKLVVMDIAPVEYQSRHEKVIKGLQSVPLKHLSDRKEAQQCLAKCGIDAGTSAFLLKSLYQDSEKCWQWRFNLSLLARDYHLLSAWPFDGVLYDGDITFIKGQNSDYITAAHQRTILSQFPNAKAKIVNAGHWLHAEKPQLVNTLLTRILLSTDK